MAVVGATVVVEEVIVVTGVEVMVVGIVVATEDVHVQDQDQDLHTTVIGINGIYFAH